MCPSNPATYTHIKGERQRGFHSHSFKMALSGCTQHPPPPSLSSCCHTVYLLFCAERMRAAAHKVLIARRALFPLRGKEERGRRRPSTTRGGGKKKHTRPVMQKHRFNVRLASYKQRREEKAGLDRREEGDGDQTRRKRRQRDAPLDRWHTVIELWSPNILKNHSMKPSLSLRTGVHACLML